VFLTLEIFRLQIHCTDTPPEVSVLAMEKVISELLVEIKDKKLKHINVEDRLKCLTMKLDLLIKRYGFIPNTGQMTLASNINIQISKIY
jgi:hypothetical protein